MAEILVPPLPGGVGVSALSVYAAPAPDGLVGGSPHLHLCCSEAYVVVEGGGRVQTLTLAEGFRETPLRPGAVLWFTPGTIHRLVNDGGLRIVVLMQNSGLPEAGDAVLTFPAGIVADPVAYAEAATLPGGGAPGTDLVGAFRRRDLAVTGFEVLRDAAVAGDPEPLREFHRAAAALVAPKLPAWRERYEAGALRAAQDTAAQFAALEAGDVSYLDGAGLHGYPAPVENGRHGMCGLLDTYPLAH